MEADRLAGALVESGREAGDDEVVAAALRAQGLARRELGDLAEARRYLEAAVEASSGRAGALARGSLASVLAATGELAAALDELEVAARHLTEPSDRAPVEMQRGGVLSRLGRRDEALDAFGSALAGSVAAGDARTEALTRINRAILLGYAGRFDAADDDLAIAEDRLRSRHLHLLAADCHHNRGFVAGRRGEVVRALTFFDEARAEHERLGVDRASAWMDECEVLLAVRLAPEARALASDAEAALVRSGQLADAAEAQLLVARACELDGDLEAARAAADRASASFAEQGRSGWSTLADLIGLRVGVAAGRKPPAAEAMALASTLFDAGGRVEEAVEAALLAGRIALDDGDEATALAALDAASAAGRGDGSAGAMVAGWYAEAMARRTRGDEAAAMVAARRGVEAAADAAVVLGARELRSSAVGRGEAVAALGVELALARGGAETILRWGEALRATSLAMPRVRPPADDALRADLAALREASRQVEDAALAGDDAADAIAERARLERAVLRRSRRLRSDGRSASASSAGGGGVSVGALRERLAGRTLVELVRSGDRLVAVHVGTRRSRVVEVGSMAAVESTVEALRFALGRSLSPTSRPASADAARSAVLAASTELGETLFRRIHVEADGLVIVPTGALHHVPWAVLPALQGCAMTVAPSARAWLAADERRAAAVGPVVVVAGPGIPGVADEVAAVAASYGTSRSLVGAEATVAAVADALQGAAVAHVAAHGHFRSDSPLFSALALHDGPLTVHDLDALGAAPAVVFLSACDVGRSSVSAGDESSGVVSAFLGLGTSTLVASVLPVPDALAAEVAARFHRSLAGGARPAAALVGAVPAGAWSPFVAFGSG